MSKGLEKLLIKCENSTNSDFEGSDTYRLHYKKAQKLIKEAYKLGQQQRIADLEQKLAEAYKQGWIEASQWAGRDDILGDADSDEYNYFREKRMAKLQPPKEVKG